MTSICCLPLQNLGDLTPTFFMEVFKVINFEFQEETSCNCYLNDIIFVDVSDRGAGSTDGHLHDGHKPIG